MNDTAAALLAASGLPTREARALLAHVLAATRESLVAAPEQHVASTAAKEFCALAERRRAGEPLAYLLGAREFYGRPFRVTPAVLVPRPETELLVEHAVALLRGHPAPRIVDLGTGSGCIAITLALELPAVRVHATDVSTEALAIAAANARALGAEITFSAGDWYGAVPAGARYDLVVSNPPYVAAADPHLDALRFEPALALTDGGDGLAHLRRIATGARAHLAPGGVLLVEHGHDQGAAVRRIFVEAGLSDVESLYDLQGHARAVRGRQGD